MREEMGKDDLGEPGGSEPSALTEVPKPEHLNLGEVIAWLENVHPAKVLPLGFRDPCSYRGDYYDLAFEVRRDVRVADMLADARSALDATFQGHKGGDFTMRAFTPVWLVADYSSCGESLGALLMHALIDGAAFGRGEEA